MRITYNEDEGYPGQFALWEANCRRSIRGRRGQAELKQLEAALRALPQQRLTKDTLVEGDDVCAIGAYARYKGFTLADYDPEDETDQVGVAAGMPRLVAWSVVAQNDLHCNTFWGIPLVRDMTPEERYVKVLAWVRGHIVPPEKVAYMEEIPR